MCKAATPAVTLAVGLALGVERLSLSSLSSTCLIAAGVAIATAAEAATGARAAPGRQRQQGASPARRAGAGTQQRRPPLRPASAGVERSLTPHPEPPLHRPHRPAGHMHWPSFISFVFSIVFESIRVALAERMLGAGRYDVLNALVYMVGRGCVFVGAAVL